MNIQVSSQNEKDDIFYTLTKNPHNVNLFTLMRRLEVNETKWGYANKYRDEILQFGQEPSPIFASSSVAKIYQYPNGRKPKLSIHSFGLFGSNGVMPLVFTEYAKERINHHDDYALSDFIDIFHNRLIMLFYRAWADSNSCVSLDKKEDNFTRYINSLCASGYSHTQKPDSIPSHARWHNAGHLLRKIRTTEGLQNILSEFFSVPVYIEEFVNHWLSLPEDEQTCLGNIKGAQLGFDAVLGRKVMGKQHFRIHFGPLTPEEHNQFLPGTNKYQQIQDWVRTYVGMEFSWDLCLTLKKVKSSFNLRLGSKQHLGWNTWIGISQSKHSMRNLHQTHSVIFNPDKSF